MIDNIEYIAPLGLTPLQARRWAMWVVRGENGCIEWLGTHKHGYAMMALGGRVQGLHRRLYLDHVDPNVPDGWHIDHQCNNRGCINIEHLKAMTHGDNIRKGAGPAGINSRRTECANGHPLTEDNLYHYTSKDGYDHRVCKTCQMRRNQETIARRRERTGYVLRKDRTHCAHGHELTDENTYVNRDRDGYVHRRCRICMADATARSRANAKIRKVGS